jgi:hypothetical protein
MFSNNNANSGNSITKKFESKSNAEPLKVVRPTADQKFESLIQFSPGKQLKDLV